MDFFPIILVIHLLLAMALVGVILLQRSEGGALGIGGGGGAGLMSGRSAGNLLTRMTGILATAFFVTSLTLAVLANNSTKAASPFDNVPAATSPAATIPVPAEPSAPLGR